MKSFRQLIFLLLPFQLTAQIEHTQHHFAQSYLGFETQFLPGGGSVILAGENGLPETENLPQLFQPRLTIGGLHFWRHADFYMSFPVGKPFGQKQNIFSTNPALGGRYYPFPIYTHKLRPYAGINWSVLKLAVDPNAAVRVRHFAMLEAGLVWKQNQWMIEATAQYFTVHRLEYAYSRNGWSMADLPAYSVSVGLKWLVDGTAGLDTPEGKKMLADRREKLQHKLSGITLTLGPSTAMSFTRSDYQSELRPWMHNKMSSLLVPEIGIGYNIEPLKTEIRAVYRYMVFRDKGFGLEQNFVRQAIGIEAISFFANYNGFVPFAGICGDANFMRFRENDNGMAVTDIAAAKSGLTLVIGWDIRPSDTDWLVLRTTLRYAPLLHLDIGNRKLMADHFEFNFIEAVIYPSRMLRKNNS